MKIFLSKLFLIISALFLLVTPLITKIVADTNNRVIIAQSLEDIFNKNAKGTGAIFGIAVWDLKTNQQYFLNEDEKFEAASLYKLAVMYALFYLESKGKLDTSKPDVQSGLSSMVTISSNESALYLVDQYTSWNEINKIMKEKGLKNTDFSQTPILTTPKDIAKLLSLINDPDDINPQASRKMVETLTKQEINDRIPKLLPRETVVAHKTGELDGVYNDAGIVNTSDNTKYILVILTKNSDQPETVKSVIAEISLEIFNLFTRGWIVIDI